MPPKTILVTGSTDGIGKQTAHELARLGHLVIVHGRSEEKANGVLAGLRRALPGAQLESWACDLSRLDEVRARGAELLARHPRLDVLLHNAGVYAPSRTITQDGYELTFAVSHLGPFLLTHVLLPALEAAAPARVVVVSSGVHVRAELALDDLMLLRGYSGTRAYAQAKLCNVLFANGLAARFPPGVLTVNSLHPGVVGTKLLKGLGMGDGPDSLVQGAQTSVHLACSPNLEGVTGRYFSRSREATPSLLSHDVELREKLWAASEALTGVRWPEPRDG